MEYRTLPHGGERIGVIGMGSSVIGARPESEIIGTVRAAVELGVNCFDMAGGHAAIFGAYGKALQDLPRSAISLRIVAELRFRSVYLEIVLEPTGSPVSR